MAKRTVEESSLTSVADAIRERAGTSEPLVFPGEYESVVRGIPDLSIGILDGSATEVKNEKVASLRSHIFRGSGLQKADFPAVKNVGTAAFHACTSLVSVNLPEATDLESYSFFQCTSLETITLPNVQHANSESFNGCKKLRKVDFSSLVQIYASCFANCTSLEALIIRRTDAKASLSTSSPFTNTPIANGTGFIYVPKYWLDGYKSQTNWAPYASQIRAIEDYPEITGGAV